MVTPTLSTGALDALANSIEGLLITQEDDGYDDARRVYNAMHDRRPALVVRCASARDVAPALRFARDHGLAVAVRGGGQSGPGFGTSEEGVVVDLSSMRDVVVDRDARTAVAAGGSRWSDLDSATHTHGLATTGGIVSSTGVAGLTLGGGFGHLTRRFGLSCDNLLGAEVVTAAGDLLRASATEHPDLFWALRGGGGNFGVVTSLTYRLHPVAEVHGGPIVFPLAAARDVLGLYAEMNEQAPHDLGGIVGLAPIPPMPFVDPAWHGKPGCIVFVCWTGEPGAADRVLRPLRSVARTLGERVGPIPYPQLNTLFDGLLPPGLQQYWKGSFVRRLTRPALAVHLEHAARIPSPESGVFFFPLQGHAGTVASQDTAFAHRDAHFSVVVAGSWKERADNEQNMRWVRDYHDALRPHSEDAGYIDFLAADDTSRVRASYGSGYERLGQIKRRYDPDNLLHINHNIPPDAR